MYNSATVGKAVWARSSVGRATALQAEGQEFDSPRVHIKQFRNCDTIIHIF